MQAKGEINYGHLVDWHAKACQVLMQPMAVTSPQEESQSGTRARDTQRLARTRVVQLRSRI